MAGLLGPDPPQVPSIKCGIDQDCDLYLEVHDAEGKHRYYFDPDTMMAFAATMQEAAWTVKKRKNAPEGVVHDPLAQTTEFPAPPFPIS
jgi:hypothetical protein